MSPHDPTRPHPDPELAAQLARAGLDASPAFGASSDGALDVDATLASLHARLERADASPWARLKARSTRWRLRMAWGSVLAVTALTLVATPRADLTAYPAPRMLLALALCLGLSAPILRRALGAWQRPTLGAGRSAAWVLGAWLLSLGLSSMPEAHALLPHTASTAGQEVRQALGCLGFGVALGLPVFALCTLLGRDVPHGAWLAAAAAGLAGNIALQLHCPITEPGHLVAGHSTVGAGALLLLAPAALWARARTC